MKTVFLNAKAVRQYALDWAEKNKFHKYERVSPEFVTRIDGIVRNIIQQAVQKQPSKGVTIK
jgi:hypothetical protein